MKYTAILSIIIGCILFSTQLHAQEDRDSIVMEFGIKLQDSIEFESYTYIQSILDEQYFQNKFLYTDSTNEALMQFNKQIENALWAILNTVYSEIKRYESTYTFINYYEEEPGAYFLRFRMFGETGFNYHDYEIVFDDNDKPKVGDLFVYLTGSYISESLKGPYYSGISEFVDGEEIDKFSGQFEYIIILNEIRSLRNQGKIDEARVLYESIPDDIRKQDIFLIFGIQLYDAVEHQEIYEEFVQTYIQSNPNNACIYLLTIDMYFAKEEYDKSLAMIDSLMMVTGDDLLPYLKGNLFAQMEDYINAENMYEFVAENYPYFDDNWLQLVHLYILQGKNAMALRCLDKLVTNCEYPKADLVMYVETDYGEFSKQEDFQKWAFAE